MKEISKQKLYSLLLNNRHRFVSQEEICATLPNYFPLTKNEKDYTKNRSIWEAVKAINNDPENQIVIIKNRAYKIATYEEAKGYISKKRQQAAKIFSEVEKLAAKLNTHGSLNLLNGAPVRVVDGVDYEEV